MAAKFLLAAMIVCVVAVQNCYGLSCPCQSIPRDDPRRCPDEPTSCPPGKQLIFDHCGCCLVCSQGKGEECGGPWKVMGTCSSGLVCMDDAGNFLTYDYLNPILMMRIGKCADPRDRLQ